MKKVLVLIAAGFSFGLSAQTADQHVIGSLGGSFVNANIDVNYTAGEAVIQTQSTAQVIVTQGFHQPDLDGLGGLSEATLEGSVHLYPNPTNAVLNVQLDEVAQGSGDSELMIYDLNGQQVYQETVYSIGSGFVQLNVEALPPGHYQLRIISANGVVSRAKFVKS